jgi:hypothetical protein
MSNQHEDSAALALTKYSLVPTVYNTILFSPLCFTYKQTLIEVQTAVHVRHVGVWRSGGTDHLILIDEVEWSASRFGYFTLEGRVSGTH